MRREDTEPPYSESRVGGPRRVVAELTASECEGVLDDPILHWREHVRLYEARRAFGCCVVLGVRKHFIEVCGESAKSGHDSHESCNGKRKDYSRQERPANRSAKQARNAHQSNTHATVDADTSVASAPGGAVEVAGNCVSRGK